MKKLTFLALALTAAAADVTLQWDPSVTANVTYNLYWSTNFPFTTSSVVNVGTNLTSTVKWISGPTRFFVTALSETLGESEPSNYVLFAPNAIKPPGPLRISVLPKFTSFTNSSLLITIEE